VSRVAYSDADIAGRAYAMSLMEAAGLKPRIGAGHDAQAMALLGPMGMIFVASVGGISHSPRELTRWEDCANGARVLHEVVLS
jgi:acetylornithine deacetylase/succinyl-diaminopimelate desuccinylase-like protein